MGLVENYGLKLGPTPDLHFGTLTIRKHNVRQSGHFPEEFIRRGQSSSSGEKEYGTSSNKNHFCRWKPNLLMKTKFVDENQICRWKPNL